MAFVTHTPFQPLLFTFQVILSQCLNITLDQRFPYKESEEKEPLVACNEAFQMIGPIKLSHSTGGSGLISRSDEHRTQTTLKRAG